jgi:hypothetical protein
MEIAELSRAHPGCCKSLSAATGRSQDGNCREKRINNCMCSCAVFRGTRLCAELMQLRVAETCDQRSNVSASRRGSTDAIAWTN